jgi:hypothetical protein
MSWQKGLGIKNDATIGKSTKKGYFERSIMVRILPKSKNDPGLNGSVNN